MLCSEPLGYPSQTIHLKTASWPWQKASSDCQSTPVCWSMPSSSEDWGESLKPFNFNAPIKEYQGRGRRVRLGAKYSPNTAGSRIQFLAVAPLAWQCFQANTTGHEHRWEGWGLCPCCCAGDSHWLAKCLHRRGLGGRSCDLHTRHSFLMKLHSGR